LVQVAKSHEGNPSNPKTKNRQLAEVGPTESTKAGNSDVFSTAMAQILVPYY
jgi:hypothetical protein